MILFSHILFIFTSQNSCATNDDRTYYITVQTHTNDELIKVIKNENIIDDSEEGTLKALSDFYGPIFEDLNNLFAPFRVQFNLDLSRSNTKTMSGNFDMVLSCTRPDSLQERTAQAHDNQKEENNNTVAFQLFHLGCVGEPVSNVFFDFLTNGLCGRTIGTFFKNIEFTPDNIKLAVLSGLVNDRLDNMAAALSDPSVISRICSYVTSCLSTQKTDNGVVILDGDAGEEF